MAVAYKIREVPDQWIWPDAPAPVLYRCEPPMPEHGVDGVLIDSHEYVIAATTLDFRVGDRHVQHAEACLFGATADGLRKGASAKAIAKYSQAAWTPNVDGLFFLNGYRLEGS